MAERTGQPCVSVARKGQADPAGAQHRAPDPLALDAYGPTIGLAMARVTPIEHTSF